ncbi:hypothetical protein RJT34_12496 [Clitoria ternatea]|uniref:Uncharacterized protein n=1 Tax=Clitoria ternatea TaxID=43366 RepID=A0AAN9JPP4_CLITE
MGLLGKSFTSKIKTLTTLAISRMVILKNQHKARASYAWSDVAQLLNLGYHDRALHRVKHWITEQDMLQGFAMIESYCNFLREGAEVLEMNKLFNLQHQSPVAAVYCVRSVIPPVHFFSNCILRSVSLSSSISRSPLSRWLSLSLSLSPSISRSSLSRWLSLSPSTSYSPSP